jgi:hypothetical protein
MAESARGVTRPGSGTSRIRENAKATIFRATFSIDLPTFTFAPAAIEPMSLFKHRDRSFPRL